MRLFVLLIIMLFYPYIGVSAEQKNVPVQNNSKEIPGTTKPHAPAKINVEAWLDDNMLSISFLHSEGEASITFESNEVYNQGILTFNTEVPFVIDLTTYGEVYSFTIETEAGRSYIGYLTTM